MTPTKCKRRHTKTILAIMTVLAMLMSLVTVAAAAEPSIAEQRLQAQAIAQSAQSLRLSATELDLKAGDTYELRVLPAETATAMGWQFDEEKLAAANSSFLTVENVDQAAMTVTVKAVRSGGNVPVKVELANPTLTALAKAHSSLMTYVRLAQNSLQQYMVCQVATNDTATQVVAGMEAPAPTVTKTTTTAAVIVGGGSSSSGISGGSGTTLPPQQPGGTDDPNKPGTGGDNPGGNTGDNPGGNTGDNPGGDTTKCPHGQDPATCPECNKGTGGDDPGPAPVIPPVDVTVTADATLDTDTNKATAIIDDATAVTEAITAEVEKLGDDDESTTLNVALDVTCEGGAETTDLSLSAEVVAALAEASETHGKDVVVTVTSDTGVVELPLSAIKKAQADDAEAAVTLAVGVVDTSTLDGVTDEEGTEIEAEALENAVVVDVTLKTESGDAAIEGLTEEIKITVAAPSGAERVDVYFINGENALEHIGAFDVDTDSEQVTFGVDHLTTFVVKEAESTTPPVTPDPGDDPCKDGHTGTADADGNCSACGKPMGGSSGGDAGDTGDKDKCQHGNDPSSCEECKKGDTGDDGKCEHGQDPATCPDCNKGTGGDNTGDDGKCEHGNDPLSCEECKKGSGEDPKPNPDDSKCEHGNDPASCTECNKGGTTDPENPDGTTNPDDKDKPGENTGDNTGSGDGDKTDPNNPGGSGNGDGTGDGDKDKPGESGGGDGTGDDKGTTGGDNGSEDTGASGTGGQGGNEGDNTEQSGNGQGGGDSAGEGGENANPDDGNDLAA